ncbi:MAG: hypothetical protein V1794_10440, partial [Candidatus Glassbacteria bacterium]
MKTCSLTSLAAALAFCIQGSIFAAPWAPAGADSVVVFEDDFSGYPLGALSEPYTAVQEYHWTPKNPKWGPWDEAVYWGFFPVEKGLAWHIRQSDGRKVLFQQQEIPEEDKNAVVVTGDELWRDYAFEVELVPLSTENPVGIIYRVENSRNYYAVVLAEGHKWFWIRRIHDQWVKSKVRNIPYQPGKPVTLRVQVEDRNHRFFVDGREVMEVVRRDHYHPLGKVGLIANSPAEYRRVRVVMSREAHEDFQARKAAREAELAGLRTKYPQPVLWKKVDLRKLAVNGRQMRWGDLDGDGDLDFVIAQRHYGSEGALRRYIAGLAAFDL